MRRLKITWTLSNVLVQLHHWLTLASPSHSGPLSALYLLSQLPLTSTYLVW